MNNPYSTLSKKKHQSRRRAKRQKQKESMIKAFVMFCFSGAFFFF